MSSSQHDRMRGAMLFCTGVISCCSKQCLKLYKSSIDKQHKYEQNLKRIARHSPVHVGLSIASPSDAGDNRAWYLVINLLPIPLWPCIRKYLYCPGICGGRKRLNYICLTFKAMWITLLQYCGWWWPGDARNQVFNCYCINPFHPEHPDLSRRNIGFFLRKWLDRVDPLHTISTTDLSNQSKFYHCGYRPWLPLRESTWLQCVSLRENILEICCPLLLEHM